MKSLQTHYGSIGINLLLLPIVLGMILGYLFSPCSSKKRRQEQNIYKGAALGILVDLLFVFYIHYKLREKNRGED